MTYVGHIAGSLSSQHLSLIRPVIRHTHTEKTTEGAIAATFARTDSTAATTGVQII